MFKILFPNVSHRMPTHMVWTEGSLRAIWNILQLHKQILIFKLNFTYMYIFTKFVYMFAVVIRCQILSILYLGYIMTLDKDLGSQEIDNDQNDRDDCLFDPKTV